MCLVYNISAIWNPSAEVFEQFAATDFARMSTDDHLRSPTITYDHLRSPTITHDHPRPLRPIVQAVYDIATIPTFLGRS